MAIVNPGLYAVYNSVSQPLYTIETDPFGKTVYASVGDTAALAFDTAYISVETNIGYDDSANQFTFNTSYDNVFTLTGTAEIINFPTTPDSPVLLQWYNVTTDAALGGAVPIGATATAVVEVNDDNARVELRVISQSGNFTYPAAVVNAQATVVCVAGFNI